MEWFIPTEQPTRHCLIYEDAQNIFIGGRTHFYRTGLRTGIHFLCQDGVCCETLGKYTWRVGVVLLQYLTLEKEPKYALHPWFINSNIFNGLGSLRKMETWTEKNDFTLQYNHSSSIPDIKTMMPIIIPRGNSDLNNQSEEFIKGVIEKAKPVKEWIQNEIGVSLFPAQIEKLLKDGYIDTPEESSKDRITRYTLALDKHKKKEQDVPPID
jgi:hypothetical protein